MAMNISKIRTLLYRTARILGDVDAARKGRLGQRLWNRGIGKITSRFFRRF